MATEDSTLERVNRELQARERARSELKEDERLSPVVVFENISLEDFNAWLEVHEEEHLRWIYEPIMNDSGRVVVYELTSDVHAANSGEVIKQIYKQVIVAGDNNINIIDTLDSQGGRTVTFGGHCYKPGGGLRPAAASPPSFPTLVVEMAFAQEVWSLEGKLDDYMENPHIQVAIGVMVPYRQQNVNQCVYLYQRDANNNVVREHQAFDAHTMFPDVPLSFPLGKLYHGTRMPPGLEGHEDDLVIIDLDLLDDVIQCGLRHSVY